MKYLNGKNFKQINKVLFDNSKRIEKKINGLKNINPSNLYKGQKFSKKYQKSLNLPDNYYPIKTKGDGNCLYNSISQLYFKDEAKFFIIKVCSIFTLLKQRIFFEKIINNEHFRLANQSLDYCKYIEKASKNEEYGTELDIASLMIMLNSKIFVYVTSKKDRINRYIYQLNELKTNRFIHIGLVVDHYFLILFKKEINFEKNNVKEIDILKDFIE